MVRRLHEAGIEVIMDVVYNHTAEGNQMGPTLSFRGIDNASYYTLADDPRYYFDTTGTGNSLEPAQFPRAPDGDGLLRYWVQDCHVDGFRFDLATTLGRDRDDYSEHAVFLEAMRQDPVLAGVKLIAEPWDTGAERLPGGQLPPRLGRMERPVPRHRARLLEGRRRAAGQDGRQRCWVRPRPSATTGGGHGPA